ncbi:DNA photolyase family protein [Flavobacteriaceae bacterium]|nr:DNA photolyase family protein [Flavobacteriaceae bacterium]
MKLNVFWFRRDLRIEDNIAWNEALYSEVPLLPIFIFDDNILEELTNDDPRVNFIYERLELIHKELLFKGHCGIQVFKGKPLDIFKELFSVHDCSSLFLNEDYEPYARQRDSSVSELAKRQSIEFKSFTDHVFFHPDEILKKDGTPYTVYTPYKNKWLLAFADAELRIEKSGKKINSPFQKKFDFPTKSSLNIVPSKISIPEVNLSHIKKYDQFRDDPARDATTYVGTHLRFGTIGIRTLISQASKENDIYFSELIWRSFFIQILFHFPHTVNRSFKSKYEKIPWRNNLSEFEAWCKGETGIDLVDAGMKQLNETGFMHNRVRMVCASFLTKNLLIDWRWGEAYFANKLLDFELASNNGNWQWSAGTGCDASPYFRVFNPDSQAKKFDPKRIYIERWLGNSIRPPALVNLKESRKRAIETYKIALNN